MESIKFKITKEVIEIFVEHYERFYSKKFKPEDFERIENLKNDTAFVMYCIKNRIIIPCINFINLKIQNDIQEEILNKTFGFELENGIYELQDSGNIYLNEWTNLKLFKNYIKSDRKFNNFCMKFEKVFNLKVGQNYGLHNKVIESFKSDVLPEKNIFIQKGNNFVCLTFDSVLEGVIRKGKILYASKIKIDLHDKIEAAFKNFDLFINCATLREFQYFEKFEEEDDKVLRAKFKAFSLECYIKDRKNIFDSYAKFYFGEKLIYAKHENFKEFLKVCNFISLSSETKVVPNMDYSILKPLILESNPKIQNSSILDNSYVRNTFTENFKKDADVICIKLCDFYFISDYKKAVPLNLFLMQIIKDLEFNVDVEKYLNCIKPLVDVYAIPEFFYSSNFIYAHNKKFELSIQKQEETLILQINNENKTVNTAFATFLAKESIKNRFKKIVEAIKGETPKFFAGALKFDFMQNDKKISFEYSKNNFSVFVEGGTEETNRVLEFIFNFDFKIDSFLRFLKEGGINENVLCDSLK